MEDRGAVRRQRRPEPTWVEAGPPPLAVKDAVLYGGNTVRSPRRWRQVLTYGGAEATQPLWPRAESVNARMWVASAEAGAEATESRAMPNCFDHGHPRDRTDNTELCGA